MRLRERLDRIELVDHTRPLGDIAIARHAKPDIEPRGVRLSSFEDVDEAGVFEDHDLPVDVRVIDGLGDRSEGDVLGHEVAHVAFDIVPIRKARQLAARGTDEMHMLAKLLGFAELDGEVGDEGKGLEVDGGQRVDVVGARQLELLRIGEDFQSVGSMR
jgi:hypothetical protein